MKAGTIKTIFVSLQIIICVIGPISCRDGQQHPYPGTYTPKQAAVAPPSSVTREEGLLVLDIASPEPDLLYIGDQRFTLKQITEIITVLAKNKAIVVIQVEVGPHVNWTEMNDTFESLAPNIKATFVAMPQH